MPRCQTPDTAGLRPAPTVPVGGADPQRRHDSAGADAKAATGPRMLVAAYARVSSDRPDREQTIDSQSDALRRAAEQRGWHLAADLICRDDGRTGTTLVRPGLDRRRDLVAEGTGAAVLLCSPDRLARNFASQVFASQVLVIDQFRPAGCEVVFLNQAFGDSPEPQRLLQMHGVFAEDERPRQPDNAIGMTYEQLANVFGPFAQADSSASRRYGGAGVGLAVSRRLCHLMGGDIEVASVSGQGTTVTVKLPAERGGN
jgi:hypothetical protein